MLSDVLHHLKAPESCNRFMLLFGDIFTQRISEDDTRCYNIRCVWNRNRNREKRRLGLAAESQMAF